MTQTVDYDIVGSYNNQRVSSIDAERSINMFEYRDPLGKKPKTLINTSGLTQKMLTFFGATGGFRAEYTFLGVHYCVIGDTIFSITSGDIVSKVGNLTTQTGYVGVDGNTFQLTFVDGVHGYVWDTISSTFTQITDPSFPINPIDICTLDNFTVVISGNTPFFQLSSLDQSLVWGADNAGSASTFTMGAGSPNIVITYASGASINNYQIGTPIVFAGGALPAELVAGVTYFVKSHVSATTITVSATDGGAAITSAAGGNGTLTNNGQLQRGQITTHPGTIAACRTLHRRLFLFSQFYTEVWENAGFGTTLPFRRNNALLMEYGTAAIGSVSVGFDKMYFLSQDRDGLGAVMQVVGTESLPVSTRALDFQLAQYAALGQVSDCRSFLIKENGLIFYRMNFTAANHTFVYNVSQSKPGLDEQTDQFKFWHEEQTLGGNRHPAQTHSYFNGLNYVGDYLQPIMYIVDVNEFTNNGEAIERIRITRPIVPPGYQRMRIDRLQIDLLQGSIENIESQFEDQDLLTENFDTLLTESGNEILLEQGILLSNPDNLLVYLSISKDGGQSYGSPMIASMGNIGQRTFRTLWRKLGVIPRGQAFVAKFQFFNDSPFIVLGASWAVDVLPE